MIYNRALNINKMHTTVENISRRVYLEADKSLTKNQVLFSKGPENL
jgi:hypothetical protein